MANSSAVVGMFKRRATDLEVYYTLAHENNAEFTCYTITLAAKCPIHYDQVHETLLHLFRKFPNLRVRIWRDEDGQLWTGAMEEEKVLLKFLDDSHEPEKVHIEETRKQHAVETGPMWRVSVIPAAHQATDAEAASAGFHHQYYVMFSFHHAITDGHSTMRICSRFLAFLNAAIEGTQIDDKEQLAEFVDDCFHGKLMTQAKEKMKSDVALREQFTNEIAEQNKIEVLLCKAYPPTNDPKPKTETVWRELDEIKMQSFTKKVKMEKMTIHSAFATIIHGAMIDLLMDAGLMQETYQLVSIQDINERRYWDHDGEKAFGVHVGAHRSSVSVPCDILNNFWETARAFHTQFQDELQIQHSILMAAVESETKKTLTKSEDFYKNQSPCSKYYAISNMGDITRFLKRDDGTDYDQVQVRRLRRSTCIHSFLAPCCFRFQTLNGKLLCSLDYNTRFMSYELANNLINRIFDLLEITSE